MKNCDRDWCCPSSPPNRSVDPGPPESGNCYFPQKKRPYFTNLPDFTNLSYFTNFLNLLYQTLRDFFRHFFLFLHVFQMASCSLVFHHFYIITYTLLSSITSSFYTTLFIYGNVYGNFTGKFSRKF